MSELSLVVLKKKDVFYQTCVGTKGDFFGGGGNLEYFLHY